MAVSSRSFSQLPQLPTPQPGLLPQASGSDSRTAFSCLPRWAGLTGACTPSAWELLPLIKRPFSWSLHQRPEGYIPASCSEPCALKGRECAWALFEFQGTQSIWHRTDGQRVLLCESVKPSVVPERAAVHKKRKRPCLLGLSLLRSGCPGAPFCPPVSLTAFSALSPIIPFSWFLSSPIISQRFRVSCRGGLTLLRVSELENIREETASWRTQYSSIVKEESTHPPYTSQKTPFIGSCWKRKKIFYI